MKAKIAFVILGIVGLGGITFSLLKQAHTNCEICIEFNNQNLCANATGPNEKEASEEAHRNACARLASGVTETLACHRIPDKSTSCRVP